ncbi:MAG: carbon starvation protein A, partial [Candidatus Methanomethylophilaceae archaeon]
VRNKGRSIGELISESMGTRAKRMFLIFAYLTLILLMSAFASIVANTFDGTTSDPSQNLTNGMAASISMLFIAASVILGILMNRFNLSSVSSAVIAVIILLVCIVIGMNCPIYISGDIWFLIQAVYIVVAAVIPVWILLQPRDYLCSFLLYGIIGAAVIGVIFANPSLSLPGFTSFETKLGYLFPALFITVACGAISGFHSLVASGTTAKQIDNERHILSIGYGGMLIECVMAIIALICVGILYSNGNMPDGTPTQIFAKGISTMLSSIGLQDYEATTYSLVILAVSAFALTSLDTATRLARFMLQEFFLEKDQKPSDLQGYKRIITNPIVATVLTVFLGMALASVGYEKVWGLFGAANQLLAVLALLAVCAWLENIGKSNRMLYIPMMFMLAATLTSLLFTIGSRMGDLASGFDGVAAAQLVISIILFIMAVFLMVEGLKVLNAQRLTKHEENT